MKRQGLVFKHWQNGKPIFPFSLCPSEPLGKERVWVNWTGNSGKDWSFGAVLVIGSGRYLSLRHYSVAESLVFNSQLSEKAICVCFLLASDEYKTGQITATEVDNWWDATCELSFVGAGPFSHSFSRGYHQIMEIIYRLDELDSLIKSSLDQKILDKMQVVKHGKTLLKSIGSDDNLESQIKGIIRSIQSGDLTAEKYKELCDKLLIEVIHR
ncbi:MAG: hypothetical protein LBJ04_16165 [Sphingobacterium sp.]|jgi:hypothetical protein|nr:hypothetical protein [Sphingobacterium sp.]